MRKITLIAGLCMVLFAGLAVETPGGRFGLLVEPRYTLRDGSDPFWMTLGVSIALD